MEREKLKPCSALPSFAYRQNLWKMRFGGLKCREKVLPVMQQDFFSSAVFLRGVGNIFALGRRLVFQVACAFGSCLVSILFAALKDCVWPAVGAASGRRAFEVIFVLHTNCTL